MEMFFLYHCISNHADAQIIDRLSTALGLLHTFNKKEVTNYVYLQHPERQNGHYNIEVKT